MKLTIGAAALNAAAAWAAKIAPSSPRIPVTAGVKLDATDKLRISVSDFDIFATVEASGATVGEPGTCAVSARLLASLAKVLNPADEVTIETSGKGLALRCKRLRAGLPEMDAAEWPTFPALGYHLGTVEAATLSRCLARVMPAVGPPDAKPVVLSGVLLDTSQVATLVATDAYRAAAAELDWRAAGETGPLVIPADLLRAALDVANSGDVTIHSDGSTVSLSTDRHRVTGRLHAGKYVAWRAVMDVPESFMATVVTVGTGELTRAVAQVSAVSTPTAKVPELIRLEVGPGEVGVFLESDSDATGDNGVDLHTIVGPPITVGVAHRYLLDALAALGSPMTVLTFTDDPAKPFLFQSADKDGTPISDGYRHILMTRKLRGVE